MLFAMKFKTAFCLCSNRDRAVTEPCPLILLRVLAVPLFIHSECMRFAFTRLLRCELQRVGQLWNEHHIRYSKNCEGPSGKPDQMYFLPELYGM